MHLNVRKKIYVQAEALVMTADDWTNPKEGTGEISYSICMVWNTTQLGKITRALLHGYGKLQGVLMGEGADSGNMQLLCKRRMEMRTFFCIRFYAHIRKSVALGDGNWQTGKKNGREICCCKTWDHFYIFLAI